MNPQIRRATVGLVLSIGATSMSAETSETNNLAAWLAPQEWARDTDQPAIALGEKGAFDDMHIFAPEVARMPDGRFLMWYCGSTGATANRIFHLGAAWSEDGVRFKKHGGHPVFSFGGETSILTPTLLRELDGAPAREGGKLRMWFCGSDLTRYPGPHRLYEITSEDGLSWSKPSEPQLDNCYAPSVVRTDEGYMLWFTNLAHPDWAFTRATSPDGRTWEVDEQPIFRVSQPWESYRLFYPRVVKAGAFYCMWYGSYWKTQPGKTALGFAVSRDGVHWAKHPGNPVLTPEPKHPWESHYTTSETVMRLPDGSWRIWYATRSAEAQTHKYLAIGTAWCGGMGP